MKIKKVFTLVELIIVIAIIAILSVLAYLEITKRVKISRDTSRTADLTTIEKALNIALVEKFKVPLPDENITITASGDVIGYQGVFGETAKDFIGNISKAPQDGADKTYYTYYIDKTQKYFQLLGFAENKTSYNPNDANAVDYSQRYILTRGNNLGIIVDGSQTPVNQLLTGFDVMTGIVNDTGYTAIFDSNNKLSGTGQTLQWLRSNINNGGAGYNSPSNCPEGFIPVPGNKDFNQPGFCVAKYEMKQINGDAGYHIGIGPSTVRHTGENSICTSTVPCRNSLTLNLPVSKLDGKIQSKADGNPISSLNEATAIEACSSMGNGYHLITNSERMTIARNIEFQSINRITGIVGTGYIYNGNGDSKDASWRTRPADSNDDNGCSDGLGGILSGCNVSVTTNNRRTLILSNGQVIWDFSNNVWEFVNKANTINGTGFDDGSNTDILSVSALVIPWNDALALPWLALYGPKQIGLYHANGIGSFRHPNEITDNVFARGGGRDGQGGGIYALNLNRGNKEAYRMVGFRCAR